MSPAPQAFLESWLEDVGTATSTKVQALGPTSHMRTALVTSSVGHTLAATEPSSALQLSGFSFLAMGLHKQISHPG